MSKIDEEALRRRLTPEMRARVTERVAKRAVGQSILDSLPPETIEGIATGSASLESAMPLSALEAIIQTTGRPPLLIRDGRVELEPLDEFPPETLGQIKAAEAWLPSVGRIEFVNFSMAWGGTGWVIEQRGDDLLVVTNRHVASQVARRSVSGKPIFMRSRGGAKYGMAIDFGEEVTSVEDDRQHTLPIESIEYLADELDADISLLRIVKPPLLATPFNLADSEAKRHDPVALIGYPAYDSRNDASAQARYFRDLYDVKRFAPGFILSPLADNSTLSHDCTSLGGNSGSPLISLENRHVVGLHFAGLYGKENSAVGVTTLKALLRDGRTLVSVGTPPPERKDGAHPASFFKDRKGFDQLFLGDHAPTPWPALPADLQNALTAPSDDPKEPFELRYTHFGVKYSGRYKLPLITAVNIDGEQSVRVKRGADQWFTDGRINEIDQLRANNYADLEIDRGHMVRREDPNWGSPSEAQLANDDTFHYVNAAPQHSRLNQGKQLWQGLENYILDNTRTGGFKACVFTGPVIGPDDPEIDGAHVSLEFWKLVATLDAERKALRATAYLLSQGQLIRDLLEKRRPAEAVEGLVIGEYRTFQIAISDLGDALGADFSAYIAADPFIRPEEGAALSGVPLYLPLQSFDEIRL